MGGHIRDKFVLDASTTFDSVLRTWTMGPRMNAPTLVSDRHAPGNRDVLVVSGDIDTTVGANPLPQVYGRRTHWRDLTSAQLSLSFTRTAPGAQRQGVHVRPRTDHALSRHERTGQ